MTVCVTLQPTRIQLTAVEEPGSAPGPGTESGCGLSLTECGFGANLIQLCTHLIVIFMRVYSWMCLAFCVHRCPASAAVGDPHTSQFRFQLASIVSLRPAHNNYVKTCTAFKEVN